MAGCAFSTRTGCAPSLALVPQTRISVMQSTQNNQVYVGGGTWKQLTSEDNCPGPCASTYRLGPLVERPARIASMGPPPFGDGNWIGSWSALPSAIRLQWGHRLSRDGNLDCHHLVRPRKVPSMGPPPFGDGNDVVRRNPCGEGLILQWGHRLSAMETFAL